MFLHAIETFLVTVRSGSLSAAAKELNLTQTSVSKRIKALEDGLGMQLLERGKGIRQVKLTRSGEEFLSIAEQWALLSREVKILKSQGPRLSLTVGAVDSLNVFVLPRLYRELHDENASMKIEILTLHSDEMYDKVERRQLDLAFSLRERTAPNVNVEVFFSSPMVVLSLLDKRSGAHKTVAPGPFRRPRAICALGTKVRRVARPLVGPHDSLSHQARQRPPHPVDAAPRTSMGHRSAVARRGRIVKGALHGSRVVRNPAAIRLLQTHAQTTHCRDRS